MAKIVGQMTVHTTVVFVKGTFSSRWTHSALVSHTKLQPPPTSTRKIAENAHQTCSGVRINQVAPRVVLRYMAWLAWTEYIHRSSAGGRVGALCAPRASSSARAEAN